MVTEAHGILHLMVEIAILTSRMTTILAEEAQLVATETSATVFMFPPHTESHPIIHIVGLGTGGVNKDAQHQTAKTKWIQLMCPFGLIVILLFHIG